MGSTAVHAHYATQITVSPGSGLRLRSEEKAVWQAHEAALIPSQTAHALNVDRVSAWAVVFVEPETWAGRSLAARWPVARIVEIQAAQLGETDRLLFEAWASGDMSAIVAAAQALIRIVAGPEPTVACVDERVAHALTLIKDGLDGPLTLAEVAEQVHLSPSRFRHLLAEQTGMGFRAHVRWQRLLRAWTLVRSGSTVTEAAHAAGFSDGAHFSRSVRRTFGLVPSVISGALTSG